MQRPNIFIVLPAFGRMNCSNTTASLLTSAVALMNKQIGFLFGHLSYPDIDELRSVMATIFYDTMPQCTHLWMVDADMEFPPNMITDFIAFDKPLVGAIYRQKDDPISYVGNPLPGVPEIENGYLKCRDIGCGSILIRRDCLQTILEKMHQLSDRRIETLAMKEMLKAHGINRVIRFFDKIDSDKGRLSEDLSFCKRVRDCGMDVWASINHTVGHIGLKNFSGKFSDYMNEAKPNG